MANSNKPMKHSLSPLCLFALIQTAFLLSGCSLGSATVESHRVTAEEISLVNEDDIELAGTLFGAGKRGIAVVLAHSGVQGENQTGLHPFAYELAERGFTVLTFDFRGYGQTGGPPAHNMVDKDVRAAATFLRDRGFTQIVCMGVGLGGLACAKSGREPNLAGLVLISSPTSAGTLELYPEDLADLTYPKLIIVAEEDRAKGRPFAEMAQTLYDYSTEPKEIRVFSGSYHSMELFRSEHSEELHDLLLAFFEKLR